MVELYLLLVKVQQELDYHEKANKNDTPCKIIINGEVVDKPLGWEDIIDMSEEKSTELSQTTTPAGPIERTIIYKAPFAKCDREKDYEIKLGVF